LAHHIVNELVEKKGENIILLDVHEITSFTDYFILCTGTSTRMLLALAHTVMEKTKGEYMTTNRLEGKPESGWIVLDYGSIVVHLMDEELRNFYKIEELWQDGRIVLRML
jgi:ribosome-associated protein